MEFMKRMDGIGPVIIGNYDSTHTINTDCKPGLDCSVTLKSGDVSVLVKVTAIHAGVYKGEIVGFENSNAYEYEGYKPGDAIKFSYEHIFSHSC